MRLHAFWSDEKRDDASHTQCAPSSCHDPTLYPWRRIAGSQPESTDITKGAAQSTGRKMSRIQEARAKGSGMLKASTPAWSSLCARVETATPIMRISY